MVLRNLVHKLLKSNISLSKRLISSHGAVLSQLAASSNETQSSDPSTEQQSPDMSDPLKHPDYFSVRKIVTLKDLFDARVHWGHKIGSRNEYMQSYLFGNRLGVDIFDLEQTQELLYEALNFIAHIAYRGGVILFITRSMQNLALVERTATDAGEYCHCRHWSKSTLTNANVQFGMVTKLPDTIIFINTLDTVFEEHSAIVESAKCLIPTIGIVDSNCDPRLITYPIPGNDDTPSAVRLYCSAFKKAILAGKAKRKEHKLDEEYMQVQ